MSQLRRLSHRFASIAGALGLVLGIAGALPAGAVAASPAFSVTTLPSPSHFQAGDSTGTAVYAIEVKNIGGAPTDGTPITIADTLPAGVTLHPGQGPASVPLGAGWNGWSLESSLCDPGPPVTCTTPTSPIIGGYGVEFDSVLKPSAQITMLIPVDVAPGTGPVLANQVTVSGGGAAPVSDSESTPVSDTAPSFGFQRSSFSLTDGDGMPATQAGSHPYDLNTLFLLNTVFGSPPGSNSLNPPVETFKDLHVTLPRGVVVNPTATPVYCTEAQLESDEAVGSNCPDASAIGIGYPIIAAFGYANPSVTMAVNNMPPPPGTAAQFALRFSAFGIPLFVHIDGGIDSAGNYALAADVADVPQFAMPYGADVDLWGDPSDPSHDSRRGACVNNLSLQGGAQVANADCPIPPTTTPLLTMPSACSGPLEASFSADSWEHPGDFVTATAQTPAGVSGCDQLDFNPSLEARPTTNVADSPSGLDVNVHVPQNDALDSLATSNLKDATVTLPEGFALNPSAANGLEACSSAQVGLRSAVGQAPIRFSAASPSCPGASKLGTVEVNSPLVDNPLQGSVYLAKPHDNPFDSMLAIYIVVDDLRSGVVIKLAGEVRADPDSGRLVTTVTDNPELPFSDFKLNFFAGSRGVLRTPDTCGAYSTTSELAPWSGNAAATPHDDYSISQGPNGPCPSSEADQPNSPSFDAGTVDPFAGVFSPFVLNLDRSDGSQGFSQVTLSPPPGLVAKLAGTPACSESQIARAQGRNGEGGGAIEQADPSCPASSRVGVVHVAAGAGPAPFWVQGKAYLAGPYKGAPLSLAIVTPAVAGPFDLGVVVTRVAIAIDPATAQITATADPIPDHLTVDGDGFPLDVRSVRMKLDKPDFTLNGTSCDPSSVKGQLISTLGQVASLSARFQLGECGRLGFKPQMSLRLKGGTGRRAHPALTVVLKPRPGDADIASLSLAMPRSEFLENNHIRTICTRVQFAADACPAAAIYGEASVQTPILDYPLTGHVYLRSSSNLLPDVVPDLRGPASQPIKIESAGRTDSIRGGIRNTFDFIPDAPFTKLVTRLQGGRKGLLVNSRNLCARTYRATVQYTAHNGATYTAHPKLKADCKHKKQKRHHRAAGAR